MNALENDLLGQQLAATPPPMSAPTGVPTADALLRTRRRRRLARRCIGAVGGVACLAVLGVLCWAPPHRPSSPPVAHQPFATPGHGIAGRQLEGAAHQVTSHQLPLADPSAPSVVTDVRVEVGTLQPRTPDEAIDAMATAVTGPSLGDRPVRLVWTDAETGQSIAIGYLRPARIRQVPMWQLPPAIQQDIRQHTAATGDSLDQI